MHFARSFLAYRFLAVAAMFLGACNKKSGDAGPADANTDAHAATSLASATAPANGTPLPSASVAAYVNPAKLPPYSGPTGSVEGTIRITGDPSPPAEADFSECAEADKTYGKLFREGTPVEGGGRALADAIVGVIGYSGYYVPERSEARSVMIEHCAYPRVIDMTIGQRLEITNKSDQLWAPSIEQAPLPALMLAQPKGDAIRLYPPKPGHMMLVDNLKHPYARSDVWVLLHPLHAVSGLDGHYRIDGVPVGKLQVNARLSAIGREASKSIDVLAGVVQKVDLQIAYTRPEPKDAGAGAKSDAKKPVIK